MPMPTNGWIHSGPSIGARDAGFGGPPPPLERSPLRWWALALLVGGVAATGRVLTIYLADCVACWFGS